MGKLVLITFFISLLMSSVHAGNYIKVYISGDKYELRDRNTVLEQLTVSQHGCFDDHYDDMCYIFGQLLMTVDLPKDLPIKIHNEVHSKIDAIIFAFMRTCDNYYLPSCASLLELAVIFDDQKRQDIAMSKIKDCVRNKHIGKLSSRELNEEIQKQYY